MKTLNRGLRYAQKNPLTLLLGLAVLFQLFILLDTHISDLAQKIWRARMEPAPWRSASIHLGEEYAQYVAFIKNNTPEDALVIVPKEELVWNFGNVGLMQYYLYPRKIADCPIDTLEECIFNLRGTNTYILAPTSSFPPRDLADQVKTYVPFDQASGLYVPSPENSSPGEGSE